ncbi:MAG: tRNA 4-thiouridine(8) synthase ThiI [Oscillospiraceae bacterium]|jgi:thiamine biosynthesis protein ThiI|nr:tRNA 4-thiouridine(8) synthase ThiI [Oscillospiraceae bacterium]
MDEVFLLKIGELSLKGLNRRSFEDLLLKDLKRKLSPLGTWSFSIAQSAVAVAPMREGIDMDAAEARIAQTFGLAAYSRCARLPKRMDAILDWAPAYLEDSLRWARTFKCEAKRSDKTFPLGSPAICADVGEALLNAYPQLKVDVHHPDVVVNIEIREQYAFLHADQKRGAGGLPAGSAGDAVILISGGIDSPVAAWMMAKRGLRLTAVHFASPPYTSVRAEGKVHRLLGKVANYSGRIRLFTVPFTAIQEKLRDELPEDCLTLLMRRMMMRLAAQIAKQEHCHALITGESLGQVASQTLRALDCTDAVVDMPVFRPLIGMDKEETCVIARSIGTFDISIEPFEDCCTVFTPKHPKTKPKRAELEKLEAQIDWQSLIEQALAETQMRGINPECNLGMDLFVK